MHPAKIKKSSYSYAVSWICNLYFWPMTGIEEVSLEKVIIHKVGNPARSETLKLSVQRLTLNDEVVRTMLTRYFLHAFNDNELYRFAHLSDIHLNEVYRYAGQIFEQPDTFVEQSHLLARFLYSKSTHIKVKEGELYVALFGNIPFEGSETTALGIFKSESRETFLKVFPHGQNLEITQEEGININKLDKGCLIFKSNASEGYKVCIIDTANKQNDARYWITDFLQIQPYSDSYHNTDKYLGLCKNFVNNEYAEKFEVNKSDQIEMLNRSMDYFKTKEQFSIQEFASEVIHHPEVVDTFMNYKKNFEASRNFEIPDEFDIHLSAVKKQQKAFKSVLKLDKNFHVYIHGRRDLMEKGYDEMTGKKYYKIYFDEEH